MLIQPYSWGQVLFGSVLFFCIFAPAKNREKMAGRIVTHRKSNGMDMLHGSLLDKIILFALPLAASSVLQQLFNSVDIAVVGKYEGHEALAAVGSNSSVINLVITLFVGLSVGANVLIANYIGKNNRLGIKRGVATITATALISGVLLMFAGFFLARPILEAIDTPADVIGLSTLYLKIYFLGLPFIMAFNFGSAILRGMGDTKRPLYCLLVSGVVNVFLNLLLVIVFGLGVAGVAIATVVANGVCAAMVVYLLRNERSPFRLRFRRANIYRPEFDRMVKIGIPAGVQGMVFAIANVAIQSSINSFGSSAVAGSAAALNYEHFCYFIIAAFSSAAVTFMGQNYAAGYTDRCRRIFVHTMWLSLVCCAVFNGVFTWQEEFFTGVFVENDANAPVVHQFSYIRMEWVLLWQWVASSYEVAGGALRGLGHSSLPAFLTVIGTCALRLGWISVVLPSHHTFQWLMVVYPISWIVTGTMVLVAYFAVCKSMKIY